jgi:outer membrane protein OmpA-like peptidoglycan-associated protein
MWHAHWTPYAAKRKEDIMSMLKNLTGKSVLLFPCICACATVPPRELTDAQTTFRELSTSLAASAAPDEVHKAKVALDAAERAFADHPRSQEARDLAYIAQRRALYAQARGMTELAIQDKALSAERHTRAQVRLQQKTESKLQSAREQLAEAERVFVLDKERREAQARLDRERATNAQTTEKLKAEQAARADAERRADEALQNLAKIAALREEERGTVLTLSGDVLFASGQHSLLPSALQKLNQIVEPLKQTNQRLMIEGHTDSRGSSAYNQQLSYLRAQAVRDYLVGRGVAQERCQIAGYGKERPIADNATAEGRADNRRVEIVIEGKRTANR